MHVETPFLPDRFVGDRDPRDPRARYLGDELEALQQQQRDLEDKIHQLDAHLYLSPDEQVERARLKKLRLATKDRIVRLSRTPPPHGG